MLINSTAIAVILFWLTAFGVAMLLKRSPEMLCAGMLAGWLFLPQLSIDFPGVTLSKLKLVTLATGLAAFIVERRRCPTFRLSLLDLPVLGLSGAAFGASISNGLGAYDGFVSGLDLFLMWGIPWFIGKAVFATPDNSILLCRATIFAGLMYVPLCLFEMKMAPMLHSLIYGYMPRGGGSLRGESLRFGFWRPMVFMEIGLQVALFMGIASILAFWGAMTGTLRRVGGMSASLAAGVLGVTTFLCVSLGAIVLTGLGWAVVLLCRNRLRPSVLVVLAALPLVYPIFRMTNMGKVVVEVTAADSDLAQRQASLRMRVTNEDRLMNRWKQRPLLGWSTRYYLNVNDGDKAIPDSLWIQDLCKFGLLGWACMTAILIIPLLVVCRRLDVFSAPQRAEFVLAFCVLIFMLDCLFNAMENPIYIVMAGAAASVAASNMSRREDENRSGTTGLGHSPRATRNLWPPRIDSQLGS